MKTSSNGSFAPRPTGSVELDLSPGVFRLYLVYLPRNNWFTAMHIVLYAYVGLCGVLTTPADHPLHVTR